MVDAVDVADFFIDLANAGDPAEDDGITNMKLNKLLFFAQAAYLQKYGRPLFADPIQAWQYGPVVKDVYHTFKHYGRNVIDATARDYDYHMFSPEELDTLTDVYLTYAEDYTASALMKKTHKPGTPWSKAYKSGTDDVEIPVPSIGEWVRENPVLEDDEHERDVAFIESDPVKGLVVPGSWDE
jgi:uncharacterized phage-associated protein